MSERGEQFGPEITAMVTPFEPDGSFSPTRTRRLVNHLIDTGTTTVLVAGTTGESPSLVRDREFFELIETVASEVNGRIPVIVGTGSNDTWKSVHLTREVEAMGIAHGYLLVAPYYNKPPQEGMYRHFGEIANASTRPIILYNVPGRTASKIDNDTIYRLFENWENIAGVKEAVGREKPEDTEKIDRLLADRPDGLTVWSGNDADTLYFLQHGGYGVVSVASHLVGRDIESTINLYNAGEYQSAAELDEYLQPLYAALFPPTSPIASPAAIKTMLNIIGIEVGRVRSPLVDVPETYRGYLQNLLADYKLVPFGESS